MNKKQTLLLCFAAIFFMFFAEKVEAQNDPYTQISEYVFKESIIDNAIDLLSDLQQKTLENEPGCIIFDVLIGEDDASTIFIYESYESQNAFNSHIKKKYYLDTVAKLKPLTKQSKTSKVFQLNLEGEMSDADY